MSFLPIFMPIINMSMMATRNAQRQPYYQNPALKRQREEEVNHHE